MPAKRFTASSRASPARWREGDREQRTRYFPLTSSFPLPERAQAQRVEADEALGVLLVVGALVVLERDQVVDRATWRSAAGHDHVALVELSRTLPSTCSWLLSISACSISRSGANQKPL